MTRLARGAAAISVALIASSGAALASCNFIVGVGDYSVGDAETDVTAADGTDATAGQPETATVMPDTSDGAQDASKGADAGGNLPDGAGEAVDGTGADAPGDARHDSPSVDAGGGGPGDAANATADANDANSSVHDANGGSPEAEAQAPPPRCGQGLPTAQADFQKLVSTCLLAVSCDPDFFNVSISQCISYDFLESTGSIACLSTIQDCAGFYSCEGRRYATDAECPIGSSGVACDAVNNLAIDCNAGIVKNCAKYGGTCGTYTDSLGSAQVGCEVVPSCTPGDGGDQCFSTTKLYSCESNGVGYGRDCTTIGSTCMANAVDGTSCYYDAPACSNGGTNTCGAGELSSCTLEGQSLSYNCARAGGSCSIDKTGAGYCLAPGCATDSTCSESCAADGHTVTACVGNAPYVIDCAQHASFSSCNQLVDASGNPFAYCL
jgi:hypothetical protein